MGQDKETSAALPRARTKPVSMGLRRCGRRATVGMLSIISKDREEISDVF